MLVCSRRKVLCINLPDWSTFHINEMVLYQFQLSAFPDFLQIVSTSIYEGDHNLPKINDTMFFIAGRTLLDETEVSLGHIEVRDGWITPFLSFTLQNEIFYRLSKVKWNTHSETPTKSQFPYSFRCCFNTDLPQHPSTHTILTLVNDSYNNNDKITIKNNHYSRYSSNQ